MTRPLLVVPMLLGGLAAFAATRIPVSDSDLFWHLAIGRDMAAHGLPTVDAYSWTIPGKPVLADQWLGELLLYVAFAIGSWSGVVALRAVAIGAIVAVVVWTALAERPSRPLVAVLASLPALALSRFAWTDRPELFGLFCFTVLVALLRAGRRGSALAFAFCPILLIAWANLHGSYALGLGLVILVAIERAIADPHRRPRYAALAIASALATFITPAGIGTWTSSGGHFLAPPRFVQEEGTPDVATLPGLLFSASLLATLSTALLAPRRRDVLFEIVMLVPAAFVSLTATRHLVFFPIAAAPFLSAWGPEALTRVWTTTIERWRGPLATSSGRTEGPGARASRIAEAIALMVALLMLVGGIATASREPDLSAFPVSALPQLPAGPGLLNRYDWGGFLIWYAPATPVFVDGRLFPYTGEALDDYRALIGLHPDWRAVLAKRGVRTVLVGSSDAIAVEGLSLGWPILARTPEWVMLRVP